ncbi:MAG TPA: MazG family protein [Pseudonocardia sp.]|uniref:MazG family protein n=1 Tax=Pseudonocardia sp. TaxID=60912 RepID=UPI002ED9CB64
MARTLVVLSSRLGAVLPAAAVPALREAERVLADATVPDTLVAEVGARRSEGWTDGGPTGSEVLLTTNRAHPLRGQATSVVETPEPAGSALLDAIAVMDRLRSPGGCPWDAEQTHLSLLKYLVEECYELYQAVEDADRAALREELGDVLLQVLFHARVATEGGVKPYPPDAARFGIDEVAADLVRKLVDRHPHVFPADGEAEVAPADRVRTASDQEVRWDQLKRAEKRRESSMDGVATSQPAAALAAKLVSRARKAGLPEDLVYAVNGASGHGLFERVGQLAWGGADPEQELRGAARWFERAVRAAENAARAEGLDPHDLSEADWQRFWPRS